MNRTRATINAKPAAVHVTTISAVSIRATFSAPRGRPLHHRQRRPQEFLDEVARLLALGRGLRLHGLDEGLGEPHGPLLDVDPRAGCGWSRGWRGGLAGGTAGAVFEGAHPRL